MLATERKVVTQWEYPLADEDMAMWTSWLGEGLRWLVLFPVLRLFVRLKVIGVENLTKGQAYVFAANHSSHLDAPTLLAALPLYLRVRVSVAAAADYFFSSGWKGLLVTLLLNAFAFERKRSGCIASLTSAQQLLRSGRSVLIFPEGTRSRDGRIQPFKHGVGVLAETACVIPTWIDGTFAALPKGARWPRRQRVTVRFGTPLRFATGSNQAESAAEIERQVRVLALASTVLLYEQEDR